MQLNWLSVPRKPAKSQIHENEAFLFKKDVRFGHWPSAS